MRRLYVALLWLACVNAGDARDSFCQARPFICDGGYFPYYDAGDLNDDAGDEADAGSDAGDGDAGDGDAGDGGP
jgi:hypothetical protein